MIYRSKFILIALIICLILVFTFKNNKQNSNNINSNMIALETNNCSKEEYNSLLQKANNIQINYKHINDNIFKLQIYNLEKELYIYNTDSSKLYFYADNQ